MLAPLPDKFDRPVFAHKRRSSILIDMDVPSDPASRAASPVLTVGEQGVDVSEASTDSKAVTASGLGSLMKSAKHDVSVPEFDMNAFF